MQKNKICTSKYFKKGKKNLVVDIGVKNYYIEMSFL